MRIESARGKGTRIIVVLPSPEGAQVDELRH
jgi:hypothetical protein